MRLENKIAIVTGGGRGIGRAIALKFAEEGADVVVAARTKSQIDDVADGIRDLGRKSLSIKTDVSKWDDWADLVAKTVHAFKRVDVLVNNAGIGIGKNVDDATKEDFDSVIDTDLKGMLIGCHYVVKEMKKSRKGSIINISSVHGIGGYTKQSIYSGAKGGMIIATKSLAVELGEFNIRVNCISPGAIMVRNPLDILGDRIGKEHLEEFESRFKEGLTGISMFINALKIQGMPDDIAYCALYLASDEARFVTGANFVVDGGFSARLVVPEPSVIEDHRKTMGEIEEFIKGIERDK